MDGLKAVARSAARLLWLLITVVLITSASYGQEVWTYHQVAFTSTPVFNVKNYTLFYMQLTGNVTSSTISSSGGITSGTIIAFQACQDATGGHSFVWPTSFLQTPQIATGPNACTNATFFYDGSNWRQLASEGDSTSRYIRADLQPGADAGAKIAACFAALPARGGVCDARGLKGTQTVSTNPLTNAPAGAVLLLGSATFQTSVTWSTQTGGIYPVMIIGAGSGDQVYSSTANQTIIQATVALNPVLDIQDDHSVVEHIAVDGGGLAATGILMRTSRPYGTGSHATNERLSDVVINNLASTGTGLDLDAADALHGCSDCSFHKIVITGTMGTGIKIARENNQFYYVDISGPTVGVDFVGGGNYGVPDGNAFYGGVFYAGAYDITTEADSVHNAFYSVWFDTPSTNVLGNIPSGSYTDQQFSFYSCYFRGGPIGGNVLDTTNMVGTVNVYGGSFAIGQTATNILVGANAVLNLWNAAHTPGQNLTFSGAGKYFIYDGNTTTASTGTVLQSSDNTGQILLTPSTSGGTAKIGFGGDPYQSEFSFNSTNKIRQTTFARPQIDTYWGLEIHGAGINHGIPAFNTGSASDPSLSVYSPGSGQLALQLYGGEAQTVNAVAFSSTPTFDASLGNIQTITLTGSVTSSTLSHCSAGELLVFDIIQDSAGSHAFVWPSNVLNAGTIGSTASKHNIQTFYCDGANARATASMLTGQN